MIAFRRSPPLIAAHLDKSTLWTASRFSGASSLGDAEYNSESAARSSGSECKQVHQDKDEDVQILSVTSSSGAQPVKMRNV